MGAYEDFIYEIRKQSAAEACSGGNGDIQLGVMTSANSLDIGGLTLTNADLMFNEVLVKPVASAVSGNVSNSSFTDKTTYIAPLKAGDVVAVKRMSDSLYIVLGRMVRM